MKSSPDEVFQTVYDAYADALFRYSMMLTKNRERALDCTQETFVRFLEYVRRGKTVDHPKAFLFRTAKNWVIDESRKKTAASLEAMAAEEGLDPVSTRASDDIAAFSENNDMLERLRAIHPEAYELVALRHAYQFSVKELARMYDTTENAMSVRIHRAIELLSSTNDTHHEHR